MKKIAIWAAVASVVSFALAWGMMGLKILWGNYGITTEAYTGMISLAVFFACALYLRIANCCPHCGKRKQSFWKLCPYRGKEIR